MEEYFNILSQCPLFSGISRQKMLDCLVMERSAMSAEIGKLKKAGIIDSSGSRFRVLKQG